jgi:hypothetical protein
MHAGRTCAGPTSCVRVCVPTSACVPPPQCSRCEGEKGLARGDRERPLNNDEQRPNFRVVRVALGKGKRDWAGVAKRLREASSPSRIPLHPIRIKQITPYHVARRTSCGRSLPLPPCATAGQGQGGARDRCLPTRGHRVSKFNRRASLTHRCCLVMSRREMCTRSVVEYTILETSEDHAILLHRCTDV